MNWVIEFDMYTLMCTKLMTNKNLLYKKINKIKKLKKKRISPLSDFPGGTVVKNPPANAGDMGLIPGLGRFHMPQSN